MSEGREGAYERLRGKKTIGEILEIAAGFESTARDFYRDLIPRVSRRIRWLVEDLAREEENHCQLFNELRDNNEVKYHIKEQIETPASDRRFSDHLHVPDLGEEPDDQRILQFALGREHAAMEQYGALAESAPQGPIRDLFRFLANEETKHKQELEKLYYELIHSGGV